MTNPYIRINEQVEQERRDREVELELQHKKQAEAMAAMYSEAAEIYKLYDEDVRRELGLIREAYHQRSDYNMQHVKSEDVITSELRPFVRIDGTSMRMFVVGNWEWSYPHEDMEGRDTKSVQWSVQLTFDRENELCFVCRNHRLDGKKLHEVESRVDELSESLLELYKATF